jgi:hypothetical protein
VPKPNPAKPGDDKNRHESNEKISTVPERSENAFDAYVHVQVMELIRNQFLQKVSHPVDKTEGRIIN